MTRLLQRRPDAVLVLLALYFLVQSVLRIAVSPSLSVDEAQQVAFTQWLAFGYDTQPPLYSWVQYLVFSIFGVSMASLILLKNLVLFLVYVMYYRVARLMLSDRGLAVVATLGLFTIPQMFWQAQRDLTHTTASLLATCVLIYAVVRTLKRPSALNYSFIGLAIGAGMLTKYNFSVVVIAALAGVATYPAGLKRILDRRLLLTIAIAVLVFLPHLLWVVQHSGLAFDRTLDTMSDRGHVDDSRILQIGHGLLELVVTGVVIVAPTSIFFALAFGRDFMRAAGKGNAWTRFIGTILAVTAAIIVAMIFVVTLTTFRDRWLLPFLFLLPLYFALKLDAAGVTSERLLRRFLPVPLVLMVLLPIIITTLVVAAAPLGKYQHLNAPYRPFLENLVAKEGRRPALLAAASWHETGNLRMNFPGVPVFCADFPAFDPDVPLSAENPILVVWSKRNEPAGPMPSSLHDWLVKKLGAAYAEPEIHEDAVPYYYGRDPDRFHFGYAWVYPKTR